MPYGWVAAATLVSGYLSSSAQSSASDKAAQAQKDAAAAANAEQQREYDLTRSDYAPYREAGVGALGHINALMADPNSITSDPDYQFQLGQGTQAVQRSAAGAGGLYSGATLKALQRYGTDYAGTKLNEEYNRYASIAGIGQQATNGTSMAGMNMANQMGQNTIGAGNAAAANYLNQGNIWGNYANQMGSYARNTNWNTSPSMNSGNSYTSYDGSRYANNDLSGTNRGSGD